MCTKGVDTRDLEENTPLITAADAGQVETVSQLLDNGANVNSQNVYGYTPLLSALSRGHLQVATTLVQRGANVHLTSVEVYSQSSLSHSRSSFFRPFKNS